MSKSLLGPIPDDHFENDAPPQKKPVLSKEAEAADAERIARLKKVVEETKAKQGT